MHVQKKFIIMDPGRDNVATALQELNKGESIPISDSSTIILDRKIPLGHKFALKDIAKGDLVVKYGETIGVAKRDIKAGDWVHRQIESPPLGGKYDG